MEDYIKQRIKFEIDECMSKEYKRLDLRKLRLPYVPEEVYELKDIHELDLSSDAIIGGSNTYFSEEYWGETSLDNNSITLIAEAIGNMHSLEVLRLDQIELSELPDSIGDLGLLRHLSVRNNGLDKLPDSICNLINLEYLDVSFNMLNHLPKDFAKLKNLKELNLYGCAFSEVPKQLLDLPSLEKLNIGTFDKSRIWKDTAEKFYLIGNAITEIPIELFKKSSFIEIQMEHLQITEISKKIQSSYFDEITNNKTNT